MGQQGPQAGCGHRRPLLGHGEVLGRGAFLPPGIVRKQRRQTDLAHRRPGVVDAVQIQRQGAPLHRVAQIAQVYRSVAAAAGDLGIDRHCVQLVYVEHAQ